MANEHFARRADHGESDREPLSSGFLTQDRGHFIVYAPGAMIFVINPDSPNRRKSF
jgi:hypothetical protein